MVNKKRYSTKFLPLILILIDLLVINSILLIINDNNFLGTSFIIFINLFWVICNVVSKSYRLKRHYNYFKFLSLNTKNFILFSLGYFSYFTLFREGDIVHNQSNLLFLIFTSIFLIRLSIFFYIKKNRKSGNNFRNIIVLGYDDSSMKLVETINKNKASGYRFKGYFSDDKSNNKEILGTLNNFKKFVIENAIDEIYCSLSSLKNVQIKQVKKFAIRNNKTVKLIPNANELYSKNVVTEYYGNSMLVLKVKKMPFSFIENRIIKRIFDIIFSFLVCLFIMSWLFPIFWLLIKLESKGPAIFKQEREGFNGKGFICYKFRSMRPNKLADKVHAKKNDSRVTKIGAFIRKTSIDELPQFFNVLLGDMSVVGPRPHLGSLALEYQKDVDNYLERHAVKPGITGLAQISGYRGEVKKRSDIKNRVRLDIFYIENWSFLLDIKIIINTVLNVFKGDEKAY